MAGHLAKRNTTNGRRYCVECGHDWPCPPDNIARAWQLIAACSHKDADDGTCHHPENVTPECHEGACPYVR